jgi:DNA-binding MarR family transcriptional regulator
VKNRIPSAHEPVTAPAEQAADVTADHPQDVPVFEHLQTLGVALRSEWDAMDFLYHHSSSLCSVSKIARFIGYDKAEVGDALHKLEVLGLIQCSRISQGIRIYQFSEPAENSRRSCLRELMSLSQYRTGRLLLLRHLKGSRHEGRRRRDSGLRLA